jgi:tetratricopeptide (TPR) repeat protein
MNKPAPSSHFHEGRRAFESEEWEAAIRFFHAAIHADRHHTEAYIALIRAYEAAGEESEETAPFERAVETCRQARKLSLDEKQRAIVDEIADRVTDRLSEIRGQEE